MSSETTAEYQVELGAQVRRLRIRANLDQQTLAAQAGVALSALKNLESGHGATVKTLIRVLRALNQTDWLGALAPGVTVSPMQMLKTKAPRQRAYAPRKSRQDG